MKPPLPARGLERQDPREQQRRERTPQPAVGHALAAPQISVLGSVSFPCLHQGNICNRQAGEKKPHRAYGTNIYSKVKNLLLKRRKISDPLCLFSRQAAFS